MRNAMASTWSFVLSVVQIFLLLDSLSAQSPSIDQAQENSNVTRTLRHVYQRYHQWYSYREHPYVWYDGPQQGTYNNNGYNSHVSTPAPKSFGNYPQYSGTTKRPISHDNIVTARRPSYTIPTTTTTERSLENFRNSRSPSLKKCEEFANVIETFAGECFRAGILVVGGEPSKPGTTPHIVALGKLNENNEFTVYCGGTLIDPSWVLTAAHCTHGVQGGVNIARIGIQRLSANNGLTLRIKRTIRHPSYKPPALIGDIALLQLERPVSLSRSIQPACLQQRGDLNKPAVWIFGWGSTEYGGSESDTLQEAKVEFVDNDNCAERYGRLPQVPNGIQKSMVCAGAPSNNWQQDTCQGDSGGPLQSVHPIWRCLYQIIGITSFGFGCTFADSPGVYTRVSEYVGWVEGHVWPEL